MILSGVEVGDGAVIGAGCVVSKSVPPYTIVGGNPQIVIRQRFSPDQINALLKISWWNWPLDKILNALPLLLDDQIDSFISQYS